MSKKTTTKSLSTSNFTNKVLADLNKSEKDVQLEKVESFREEALIETETQLGLLKNSELPKAELELKRAKIAVEKANAVYEKSRFSTASSYSRYVENRNNASSAIDSAEFNVQQAEATIAELNEQVKTYQEILADLS